MPFSQWKNWPEWKKLLHVLWAGFTLVGCAFVIVFIGLSCAFGHLPDRLRRWRTAEPS